MIEDIELDIDSLNETQLRDLLLLGEIDSFTYQECVQNLETRRKIKSKHFFKRLKIKILKLIVKRKKNNE